VKNLNFLFWAYTLIWIVIVVYLVSLSVRLRAVSSQLQRLRARLSPDEPRNR
jgi:CcmD family protein